ncbi:MAG: hypothetical protein OXF33_00305 [Rhodospirillales bacterium]|nr:hypothetical protein [Rhodospirillales bacterium]
MTATANDARAQGVDADAGGVRRRQLLLFSGMAAAALVALALWLGAGSGAPPPVATGIDAELAGPDTAEEAWTRRSEARIGTIEARLREMETDARRLGAENERLREKLAVDAADARTVIDRQAAMIEDLERRVHGPAVGVERLVSKGYTQAEKALAGNYAKGDVVAFYRDYRRIGVAKGDERRVAGVDHARRAVLLDDGRGGTVAWKPAQIGGRKGGTEVYRAEGIELRAGDRIRWTRNDAGLGVVNSRTAEVLAVGNGRVAFQMEDGRKLVMGDGDPQLRHLDHAWASTAHAFQGRTVDNVIAAMEARHPHLTTQKGFYVEISRARDRAELVTDDAAGLRAQLQAATGERIAALEGIGEMPREAPDLAAGAAHTREKASEERTADMAAGARTGSGSRTTERESADRERSRGPEPDLGL